MALLTLAEARVNWNRHHEGVEIVGATMPSFNLPKLSLDSAASGGERGTSGIVTHDRVPVFSDAGERGIGRDLFGDRGDGRAVQGADREGSRG